METFVETLERWVWYLVSYCNKDQDLSILLRKVFPLAYTPIS